MSTRIYLLLIVLVYFSSCTTQNLLTADPRPGKQPDARSDSSFYAVGPQQEYRIRKDDKISISVWDHDELSVGSLYGIYNSNEVYGKWLQVNARGQINAPKVGALTVKDRTTLEVEDTLKILYGEWIRNPVVNVKVLNKEISVMGEVKSPGKILLEKDNNTLMEMLAKAGDFEFYANKKKITVVRVQDSVMHSISIDLTTAAGYMTKNIQILPGDIIYVPSRKGKDFEKRIATIIPFASVITAFAIGYGTFF